MPIVILTVALQIAAVVHLFRTGRNMSWLLLIILVPMIGCLAYFIVEVVPSLNQSPSARKALRRAREAIDPNRGVREGSLDARLAPKHFRRSEREWIELAERESASA